MKSNHQGYVMRINSKAEWLVRTHKPDEIKAEIQLVRDRMGDAEADDLREFCIRHWKQGTPRAAA